ncbi:hypothetical protein WMY93_021480 [Mugilogobius chulae]|uniref:Interleukin-17 receptor C/E N-terminal domain-containing protein n=1 Tax=Mugilogobius chulae TaxID=88201 RepID=A0AAW0NE19_9GOBI
MEEVHMCFLKMKNASLVSLMICCCISLARAAEDQNRLEKIEACGTKCSQGLSCKMKSHFLFPSDCRSLPEKIHTSSVFQNVSLSTVLRCEERQKCSLHLRIQTKMQVRDSFQGVSICTSSPGLISSCRIISFSRDSWKRLSGSMVDIENDCTKISLSQEVHVTVQTEPSYCGAEWTQVYTAPGCSNENLQKHVPECISKLQYIVNLEKKSVTVNVTEMRKGHNYNLRLCHAKGYICASTGPLTVIKKEDKIKSATLSYSRLLPCLCIEGWSAVTDARRIQVCPFKQHVEELWTEINFDPREGSLLWQPLCPVSARVTLCQKLEHGDCIDLPHTSHDVTRQKVKYTSVEAHPQLCMKFSTDSEDYIRCPFDVTAWKVTRHPKGAVLLSSTVPGIFSVQLCEVKSVAAPEACQFIQNYTVKVEASVDVSLQTKLLHRAFAFRLEGRMCSTQSHNFTVMIQFYEEMQAHL